MRLISFSMTESAILDRSKTVTRRLGWLNLKPGTELRGVHKCMGLRKGEHPRHLAVIRVTDVRRERLDAITQADVVAEGFPQMTPEQFVSRFCKAMRCTPETEVTRIEFQYAGREEVPS